MLGLPNVNSAESLLSTSVEFLEKQGCQVPETRPRKVPVPPKAQPVLVHEGDFDVFRSRDALSGHDAHTVQDSAANLEVCKQLCRDKGFGAFVLNESDGIAYFRRETPAVCRASLRYKADARTYI